MNDMVDAVLPGEPDQGGMHVCDWLTVATELLGDWQVPQAKELLKI